MGIKGTVELRVVVQGVRAIHFCRNAAILCLHKSLSSRLRLRGCDILLVKVFLSNFLIRRFVAQTPSHALCNRFRNAENRRLRTVLNLNCYGKLEGVWNWERKLLNYALGVLHANLKSRETKTNKRCVGHSLYFYRFSRELIDEEQS